ELPASGGRCGDPRSGGSVSDKKGGLSRLGLHANRTDADYARCPPGPRVRADAGDEETTMNNDSLDILQAFSTITGSLVGMATMTPIYAAIWTLAWMASEQRQSPIPARA